MACSSLVIHDCTSVGVTTTVRCALRSFGAVGTAWKYRDRLRLCCDVKIREGKHLCGPDTTQSCLQSTCVAFERHFGLSSVLWVMCGSAVSVESSGTSGHWTGQTKYKHACHEAPGCTSLLLPIRKQPPFACRRLCSKRQAVKGINVCAIATATSPKLWEKPGLRTCQQPRVSCTREQCLVSLLPSLGSDLLLCHHLHQSVNMRLQMHYNKLTRTCYLGSCAV